MRLIHDYRHVQELIDCNLVRLQLVDRSAKRRRPGQTERTPRFERARECINDRNRVVQRVDSDNAAGLRIQRQRSRIDADAHAGHRARVGIERGHQIPSAGNGIEERWGN